MEELASVGQVSPPKTQTRTFVTGIPQTASPAHTKISRPADPRRSHPRLAGHGKTCQRAEPRPRFDLKFALVFFPMIHRSCMIKPSEKRFVGQLLSQSFPGRVPSFFFFFFFIAICQVFQPKSYVASGNLPVFFCIFSVEAAPRFSRKKKKKNRPPLLFRHSFADFLFASAGPKKSPQGFRRGE